MSKYKLTYFPIPGRGHAVRQAFFFRGIEYEEDFVTWKDYMTMKQTGNLEWSGLPMLTIYDSKTGEQIDRFGQSNAILRYIGSIPNSSDDAKQSDNLLYPSDKPLDCMIIDGVLDACEDLTNTLTWATKGMQGDEKKAKREEMWKSTWATFFEKFDDKLARNAKKNGSDKATYFVGNSITIADLKFWNSLNAWVTGNIDYIDTKFIDEDRYKNLKSFYETVKNDEKLVAFFKDHDPKKNKFIEQAKAAEKK